MTEQPSPRAIVVARGDPTEYGVQFPDGHAIYGMSCKQATDTANAIEARAAELAREAKPDPFNPVAFFNAYEADELDEDEIADGFQHLIDSGLIHQLQGSYQRAAARLIGAGVCHVSR